MLTTKQKTWLIYKRLRTAFGVSLGLVFIYAAYTNNFNPSLLPVAIGFWSIHIFGDCYNDYIDYSQDKKNNRKDKWILSGLVTRKGMKFFYLSTLIIGLAALAFTNVYILLLGIFYAAMLTFYSNPRINLRRFDFLAYIIIGMPMLFIPFAFNTYFVNENTPLDFAFMLFAFSNYVYLYCQKDSTDLKDKTNLFIKRGRTTASIICIFFAFVASVFFLEMSFVSILFYVWTINLISKSINLYKISINDIDRTLRSRLILLEFATPYLFAAGVLLA